jgi:hypothetical protein
MCFNSGGHGNKINRALAPGTAQADVDNDAFITLNAELANAVKSLVAIAPIEALS